jgi:hypothetical protein
MLMYGPKYKRSNGENISSIPLEINTGKNRLYVPVILTECKVEC